jgi:hypothetical protein
VSNKTIHYALTLSDLTVDILDGKDLRTATVQIAEQLGIKNLDKIV